jgi:hypothetical protein
MPPKTAQSKLPFTHNIIRARETSPTSSTALSTLSSSQFDDLEDPFESLQPGPSNTTQNRPRPQSKPKLQTSWVYDHMPDLERETRYQSIDGRDEWRCRYCSRRYLIDGGTAIITNHLISIHSLQEENI